jgi:hypothetical protein
VEYLAVLRLKQVLNDEIEQQIKLAEDEMSRSDAGASVEGSPEGDSTRTIQT